MKNPHDIIKRPILTEKAYEGIDEKRYVFEVDIKANKAEIKNAIETVFAEDGVKDSEEGLQAHQVLRRHGTVTQGRNERNGYPSLQADFARPAAYVGSDL